MKLCWVNVYKGPYWNCKGGALYYLSLGYRTKADALKALQSPKSKSIHKRYLATIKIIL